MGPNCLHWQSGKISIPMSPKSFVLLSFGLSSPTRTQVTMVRHLFSPYTMLQRWDVLNLCAYCLRQVQTKMQETPNSGCHLFSLQLSLAILKSAAFSQKLGQTRISRQTIMGSHHCSEQLKRDILTLSASWLKRGPTRTSRQPIWG